MSRMTFSKMSRHVSFRASAEAIYDDISLNPQSREDFIQWLTKGDMLTNHQRKQN